MLNILTKSLKTGVLTEPNPFGTQPAFGFPVIDFERCTACGECARVCPTGAISSDAVGRRTLTLSYAACIQCRLCVTGCPDNVVSVSTNVEVAAYSRDQLAQTAVFDTDPATGRDLFHHMESSRGPGLSELAARLPTR